MHGQRLTKINSHRLSLLITGFADFPATEAVTCSFWIQFLILILILSLTKWFLFVFYSRSASNFRFHFRSRKLHTTLKPTAKLNSADETFKLQTIAKCSLKYIRVVMWPWFGSVLESQSAVTCKVVSCDIRRSVLSFFFRSADNFRSYNHSRSRKYHRTKNKE